MPGKDQVVKWLVQIFAFLIPIMEYAAKLTETKIDDHAVAMLKEIYEKYVKPEESE